jgi:hypothetical protein
VNLGLAATAVAGLAFLAAADELVVELLFVFVAAVAVLLWLLELPAAIAVPAPAPSASVTAAIAATERLCESMVGTPFSTARSTLRPPISSFDER